jgi:hypothetical protein
MGIKVEFNPDLALRSIEEYRAGRRQEAECIPDPLEVGKTYHFLKSGQRLYNIAGKTPLLRTEGDEKLSEPLASIRITEVMHRLDNDIVVTTGSYIVDRIFENGWIGFGGYGKES